MGGSQSHQILDEIFNGSPLSFKPIHILDIGLVYFEFRTKPRSELNLLNFNFEHGLSISKTPVYSLQFSSPNLVISMNLP
jgi:hypothetical protein